MGFAHEVATEVIQELVGHVEGGCYGVMMSSLKLVRSKKPKIPWSFEAKLRSGALSSDPSSRLLRYYRVSGDESEGLRSSLKLASIKKLRTSVVTWPHVAARSYPGLSMFTPYILPIRSPGELQGSIPSFH